MKPAFVGSYVISSELIKILIRDSFFDELETLQPFLNKMKNELQGWRIAVQSCYDEMVLT